ncbi:hypothetical protein PFICI_07249 [Pestalotiopsis fici W106-1]|uniref:GP-PDE domain-containing protein n=1 Tax=Pestalotiopsis fici (strain W106-1 / CGMCC3.15140) TaxID=1229662 RepID=W3XA36_PESFW|nr:uncharacterized protein PFICI_07249 [Pestalotiopsis fici W106-1]ETS82247.1 hypothetical protein PFICI_07249 [Pestalotiopsis fici W106-1]
MTVPNESTRLLNSNYKSMGSTTPAAPFASALTISSQIAAEQAADGTTTNGDGSAAATSEASSIRLPQAIAHRGYKAAFPENSLAAFRSAVEIGAHAIETDLHLSRDGVVVLSHDASLKRCFGIDKKVADCDWSYLSTLLTLREPKQSLPRLIDLLEYLAKPDAEHMWLLLDVKTHDDANQILAGIAKAIASVPSKRPWTDRIMVGCWDANYVRLSLKHLSGFPLAYIGADLGYASALLHAVPHMNFNLLQTVVAGPCGRRFLLKARRHGRAVFVWTVNTVGWMEWDIRHELDGVVTDDPKLYLEVCDRWKDQPNGQSSGPVERKKVEQRAKRYALWTPRMIFEMSLLTLLVVIFLIFLRLRYGMPKKRVEKSLSG